GLVGAVGLVALPARGLLPADAGDRGAELVGVDEHVAGLGSLGGADDLAGLEQVHQPARLREADAQLALQYGGRAELRGDHELRGLQQHLEIVADVVVDLLLLRDDGDVLAVVRRHLRLDVVDDLVDLRLVDPGALDAHRLRLAHRVEQGVALADELLRAGRVEDDAGVLQGGGREGEPAGHVRLDDAGDDVDRRALRGEDQVDPRGTGELGYALDRGLDVAGG